MFTYEQSTGLLRKDGAIIGAGYAGHNEGRMNHAMQDQHNVGPLPVGKYTLGAARTHPKLGPLAIPLTPDPGNTMFGRSAFFVHGDSFSHPGLASDGCIILHQMYRALLAKATGQVLEVEE